MKTVVRFLPFSLRTKILDGDIVVFPMQRKHKIAKSYAKNKDPSLEK